MKINDKKYQKEYREKNKEKNRLYQAEYQKKNREKIAKVAKLLIERKEPNKKCKECGKMYFSFDTLAKFCSRDCFIKEAKSSRIGKNNPAYRNGCFCKGKKQNRNGARVLAKQRKEVVNSMIEECGHVYCQNCGTSQSLRWEIHHIVYRSEAPNHENIHNDNNLIFCCIQCHNNFHSKKKSREKIIIDRKLWNEFPRLSYLIPESKKI